MAQRRKRKIFRKKPAPQPKTYCLTAIVRSNGPDLTEPVTRSLFREALRVTLSQSPFDVDGIVLLPNHFHALFTIPPHDDHHGLAGRWAAIKDIFHWLIHEKNGGLPDGFEDFWSEYEEIRSISDFEEKEQHLDYIHYNPVEHGYVATPAEWPWSSFKKYLRNDVYDPDWGVEKPKNLIRWQGPLEP